MIRDRFIRENIIDHDKNNDDRLAWFKLIRKEGSFILLSYPKQRDVNLFQVQLVAVNYYCDNLWISVYQFENYYYNSIFMILFHFFYIVQVKLTCILDKNTKQPSISYPSIPYFVNYLLNFFGKANFNQKNIYSLLSTIYPYRELINLACTWKISKLRIFLIFRIHFISIIISPVIVPFRISNHPIYNPLLPLSYFGRRLGGSSRGKGSIKIDFPRD